MVKIHKHLGDPDGHTLVQLIHYPGSVGCPGQEGDKDESVVGPALRELTVWGEKWELAIQTLLELR